MNVFHVKGLVLDTAGLPVRDVHVTIYDRDATQDDLLGLVRTDERGEFALRFLEEEFQQHFLEHEDTPDLSVILWTYEDDEVPSVLLTKDFDDIVARPGEVTDLGPLILDCPRDALVGDTEAEHIRGTRGRGLGLDDRLFGYALEQVLPIVERHTGWTGLRDHIDVTFVEDFVQINKVYQAYLDGTIEELNADPGWLEALGDQLRGVLENRMFGGIYEPLSRTIFLNQNIGAYLTLESFMVLLGHELVHLGQFTHHPELLVQMAEQSRWELACFDGMLMTTELGAESLELLAMSPLNVLMTDLEGHAQHIEQDHLSKAFGGTLPETTSLGARTMRWVVEMVGAGAMRLKRRQYILGRQYILYERARLGTMDVPVPFAKASVFLRELDLLPRVRSVWESVFEGECADALAMHTEIVAEHAEIFGVDHPRHDDIRYIQSVLLAHDTDNVLEAYAYISAHIEELTERLGVHHPRTLRERFRAATTLEANGAAAFGWRFLMEALEDPEALASGLNACSDWFEPGFSKAYRERTAELALDLRKELTYEQESLIDPFPEID